MCLLLADRSSADGMSASSGVRAGRKARSIYGLGIDDARDRTIGSSLVHRSGGDFVADAEMLLDGGDALQGVIDVLGEAGDVVELCGKFAEVVADRCEFA